ncbi:MAG: hypothetical protein QM736_20510 [Vicinamibacterales bacterium]
MSTPYRRDYELWRHPNGTIKKFPADGAHALRVRATTIEQAYWAAANLRQFDAQKQIGPLPLDEDRPLDAPRARSARSREDARRDDEAVLCAVLNALQGAPEGPVPLRVIREWCASWGRALDDMAATAALRRLEHFGFLQREPGRGKSSIIRVTHHELQQLAIMREARTAILRARDVVQ